MNLKPAILVILFLFNCTLWFGDSITFGQNFVSENKKFYVLISSINPNVPLETFIYKFLGDTLINDIDYLKVFNTSDSLEIAWTLYGFIRETEDKEVFFRNLEDSEGLLYDFDAEINDTIYLINTTSEFEYMDTMAIVVSDIDSIEINGTYKKKYILKTNIIGSEEGEEIWIEDIGNIAGPFINGALLAGLSGATYSLLCVYNDQELIYSSPYKDDCYYNTVSIEVFNFPSSITVYPNPVSSISYINLHLQNINLTDCFIEVINVYGERVKIIDIHGETRIKIMNQHFASGLYFLILRNDNKILTTQKIILL